MKSIGIDIGSSSVKVVEIQTTSKGYSINQYFIHQLSQRPSQDQDLEVIEFLRDLSTRYDPDKTKFCIGLRQDRVATRLKYFPFTERLKINKALPMELEEDIPFSIENSIFDGKVTKYYGHTAEVIACATPKTHISALLQKMSDCGIRPQIISAEGVALANLFERWDSEPAKLPPLDLTQEDSRPAKNFHLVLNIGFTKTLVCAFEGSSLIGVRTVLWGGKNIAESISKRYEIPFTEAIKEMEAKAFILTSKQETSTDAKVFSETIAKSVKDLVRDLQLSILEFRSEFNGTLERIDLTGGVSVLQGLAPFLTQMLEVPVNRTRVLDHFPQILFEKTDITDSRLGNAIGLALEGLKRPRNPALNFLRQEFATQNHRLKKFIDRWSKSLQFMFAVLVVLYAWTYVRVDLSEQLSEKTTTLLKSQAKNLIRPGEKKGVSQKDISNYISQLRKNSASKKQIQSYYGMTSAIEILKQISEAAPPKIKNPMEIRTVQINSFEVSIEGYADSAAQLQSLEQNLMPISKNGKITKNPPRLAPFKNKVVFSISFPVDRNIQKVGL